MLPNILIFIGNVLQILIFAAGGSLLVLGFSLSRIKLDSVKEKILKRAILDAATYMFLLMGMVIIAMSLQSSLPFVINKLPGSILLFLFFMTVLTTSLGIRSGLQEHNLWSKKLDKVAVAFSAMATFVAILNRWPA